MSDKKHLAMGQGVLCEVLTQPLTVLWVLSIQRFPQTSDYWFLSLRLFGCPNIRLSTQKNISPPIRLAIIVAHSSLSPESQTRQRARIGVDSCQRIRYRAYLLSILWFYCRLVLQSVIKRLPKSRHCVISPLYSVANLKHGILAYRTKLKPPRVTKERFRTLALRLGRTDYESWRLDLHQLARRIELPFSAHYLPSSW